MASLFERFGILQRHLSLGHRPIYWGALDSPRLSPKHCLLGPQVRGVWSILREWWFPLAYSLSHCLLGSDDCVPRRLTRPSNRCCWSSWVAFWEQAARCEKVISKKRRGGKSRLPRSLGPPAELGPLYMTQRYPTWEESRVCLCRRMWALNSWIDLRGRLRWSRTPSYCSRVKPCKSPNNLYFEELED